MYQDILKALQTEKESIAIQIKTLEESASILRANGLEDAAMDVEHLSRKLIEKHNETCDDIANIKQDQNREYALAKKLKECKALEDGVIAYWDAIDDKTYTPKCPYTQKYLKTAWLKGIKHTEKANGCIGNPVYACA